MVNNSPTPDLSGKQDTLTSTQLTAVNSGITSSLVSQISTNKTNIANIKLFLHMIKCGQNGQCYFTTAIYTTSATAFTFSTFCKWLYNNGFNDSGTSVDTDYSNRFWATGAGTVHMTQISSSNGSSVRCYYGQYNQTVVTISSPTRFVDKVVTILGGGGN